MISKEEKDRLKAIIADTVTLLCKNGLNAKFKAQFTVEGLIGITLDHEDLMLVSIKELVENPNPPAPELSSSEDNGESSGEEQTPGASGRKRKRKKKRKGDQDGETPAKTQKTGDDDEDTDFDTRTDNDNSNTPSATPAKRNLFTDSANNTPGASNMDNSNMESNDSFFTLHDIKQDHSDDDLIEIIKEEPGLTHAGQQPHIVSIQSLPSASGSHPSQVLGSMSQPMPPMNPGMPSPSGQMPPGQMPPGLQMAPGQYEDLMQQVELIPGSGVYIKKATYNQLQFIDKGSKLVRKLVREIFPDVHLLASSSCMGKGETSAGLDRHKVEVIKGYVSEKTGLSPNLIVHCVNQVCKEARNKLRRRAVRSSDIQPEEKSYNSDTQELDGPIIEYADEEILYREDKISVDETGKTYQML